MPECQNRLFEPSEQTGNESYVGQECHIVARRNDRRVARSVPNLTGDEKVRWAQLIDDRHGVDNLVLMCLIHARQIDDVSAGFTVEAIVDIKRAHETAVGTEDARARSGRFDVTADTSRVLLIHDFHEWERMSLAGLAKHSEEEFQWLTSAIGAPSDADGCVALIARAPRELLQGSLQLREAVARAAERHGCWSAAAQAWEIAAADLTGSERADRLVRAATAAGTEANDPERERLLTLARSADPGCLRLRLVTVGDIEVSDIDRARDILAALNNIQPTETDRPDVVALLHLQRTRAAMLADDLPAAERHFGAAHRADPESLATRSMGVNVVIQRARVGIRDDRDFSVSEVVDAGAEALRLRETLVEMRRFDESARMLMLAAEAWAVMRDPVRARPLLEAALDDELATDTGPHVLGDCALRCGHSDLALRFVSGRSDEASRRIAATAKADLVPDPTEALAELESIAAAGGDEAVMAAAARLGACMPPLDAPFSETAARVLEDSPHRRMAVGIRVLTLAKAHHFEAADGLLNELPPTPWSAELRLRAAGIRGARPAIRAAAEELLRVGPDAGGRLLVARALAVVGDLLRAQTEASNVARSPAAPDQLRAEAYAAAVRYCADRDDWEFAAQLFREWCAWAAVAGVLSDARISAWQVRIYHRGYT